jgi:hypothetical protein
LFFGEKRKGCVVLCVCEVMAAAKDFQIVRLKKGKVTFEVMVKPGEVQKFRKGEVAFDGVLFADIVFKNQVDLFHRIYRAEHLFMFL